MPGWTVAYQSPGTDHEPVVDDGPSAEYRREARRLRSKWAGDPNGLHRALHQLVRREDAQRTWKAVERRNSDGFDGDKALYAASDSARTALSSVLGVAPGSAESFTVLVRQSFREGLLPYPTRQILFRVAQQMGIGRFLANLLIAAVQHRASHRQQDDGLPTFVPQPRAKSGWAGWGLAIAVGMVIEAAIVLVVCMALGR